jgi:hypothetical protein
MKVETAKKETAPDSSAATRMSFLDSVKEGLGQTQAKLMAGLEPLAAFISKPRPETR